MAECRVPNAECFYPGVTPKNPQGYPEFSTGLTGNFLGVTPGVVARAAGGLASGDVNAVWLQRGIGNLHGAEEQRGILRLDSTADDLLHDLFHRELKAFAVFQHLNPYSGILLVVDGSGMEDAIRPVSHCRCATRFAVGLQIAAAGSFVGEL